MKSIKVNFRKHPFRGIIKEIAEERGVTRVTVHSAIRNNQPEVIKILNKKVGERAMIAESNPSINARPVLDEAV